MSSLCKFPISIIVSVGKGGLVALNHVIAVGRWNSAPIKRAVYQAKYNGLVVDLTFGEACHWVVFMDSGHLVLTPEKLDIAMDEKGFKDQFYEDK